MSKLAIYIFALLIFGNVVNAQSVIAVNAIRARTIISEADVRIVDKAISGAAQSIASVIGFEAMVNIYPGRPINNADIGAPAIIERNQIVAMIYSLGTLQITAEGRVLDRAGVGERVRIMNIDSRTTVVGRVTVNGTVEVGQ